MLRVHTIIIIMRRPKWNIEHCNGDRKRVKDALHHSVAFASFPAIAQLKDTQ